MKLTSWPYLKGLSWYYCLSFITIIISSLRCGSMSNIFKYIYSLLIYESRFCCYSVKLAQVFQKTYLLFYYAQISIMHIKRNTKSLSYFALVNKFQNSVFPIAQYFFSIENDGNCLSPEAAE